MTSYNMKRRIKPSSMTIQNQMIRNLYILLLFSGLISCRKTEDIQNTSALSTSDKLGTTFQFKPIGLSIIKDYSFPKEWKVNIYDHDATILSKDDIGYQTKLEELDYFETIKGGKNEYLNPEHLRFIKSDSLLKLSKIDSLFVVDSAPLSDGRKILTYKTMATLDDGQYEYPVKIYRVDIALFSGKNMLQTENIYSETDYPYATRENLCYLDKDGNLDCKKFSIDEEKVYYDGSYKKNLKKAFKIQ